MNTYIYNVDEENIKVIDFLKFKLKFSDNIIKKIKYGCLFVDDKNVFATDFLSYGSKLKIVLPKEEQNTYTHPVEYPLEIVYEDDFLIAVIKPKGMLTHNSRSNNTLSLENALAYYFKDKPFVFRTINRLDRDTSGIVIVAKDQLTASILNEQIKNGEIKKAYTAIVVGIPKEKHFFIDKPIERESPSSMKRTVCPTGKNALTECFFEKSLDGELSLLKIILHTGRTHQIRVHLSHYGYPLYADGLYGEKVDGKTYSLHAGEIEFTHPFTKQHINLKKEI